MFGMSLPEIAIVAVLGLIVFGPKRIPQVAYAVGAAMRELRRAAAEVRRTIDVEDLRRDLRVKNIARDLLGGGEPPEKSAKTARTGATASARPAQSTDPSTRESAASAPSEAPKDAPRAGSFDAPPEKMPGLADILTGFGSEPPPPLRKSSIRGSSRAAARRRARRRSHDWAEDRDLAERVRRYTSAVDAGPPRSVSFPSQGAVDDPSVDAIALVLPVFVLQPCASVTLPGVAPDAPALTEQPAQPEHGEGDPTAPSVSAEPALASLAAQETAKDQA